MRRKASRHPAGAAVRSIQTALGPRPDARPSGGRPALPRAAPEHPRPRRAAPPRHRVRHRRDARDGGLPARAHHGAGAGRARHGRPRRPDEHARRLATRIRGAPEAATVERGEHVAIFTHRRPAVRARVTVPGSWASRAASRRRRVRSPEAREGRAAWRPHPCLAHAPRIPVHAARPVRPAPGPPAGAAPAGSPPYLLGKRWRRGDHVEALMSHISGRAPRGGARRLRVFQIREGAVGEAPPSRCRSPAARAAAPGGPAPGTPHTG